MVLKMIICQNKEVSEELHKPIIRKFKKRIVYSSYRQYLGWWSSRYALMSKFDKGIHFLLCVIDIFSKYAWAIHLKDKKKVLQLLMLFKKY